MTSSLPAPLVVVATAYVAAGFFAAGMAALVLRARAGRAGRLFAVTVGAVALWAFADLARLLTPSLDGKLAWTAVSHLGIVVLPVAFLLFALQYTGRERFVTGNVVGLLLAVPAITLFNVVTTPLLATHYVAPGLADFLGTPLFTAEFGPWFWVHVAYSVALLALGVALLASFVVHHRREHRRQAALVAAGLSVPVPMVVSLEVAAPHPTVDVTVFAFAVAGLPLALATLDEPIVDLTPVARETVVDAMDAAVVVLDGDRTVVDCNDRARTLFGEDAQGRQAEAVLPASVMDAPLDEEEILVGLLVDGERRWYHVRCVTVRGDVEAMLFDDVTTLQQHRRQLRRQNERIEEFTAAAAHDLRNPLNVIEGYAELARESDDPADHLDRIEASAERMRGLVEDLLSLGRRGRLVESTVEVELAEVAGEAWANVRTADASLVPDPGSVQADPDRLQQLLENLFANSVEHGGQDVTVHVETLSDGFAVADDGRGIPASEWSAVFEYGYSTDEDGTGFGLSIVKIIAEAHGWSVTATRSSSGGARFEFRGAATAPEHADETALPGATADSDGEQACSDPAVSPTD